MSILEEYNQLNELDKARFRSILLQRQQERTSGQAPHIVNKVNNEVPEQPPPTGNGDEGETEPTWWQKFTSPERLVLGGIQRAGYNIKQSIPQFKASLMPKTGKVGEMGWWQPYGSGGVALYLPPKEFERVEKAKEVRSKELEEEWRGNVEKQQEWVEKHPTFVPKPEYQTDILTNVKNKNWSVLKDPNYYVSIMASNAAPTILSMAATLGGTALTGNPMVGMALSSAGMTSAEMNNIVEDMMANGATFEEASRMALPTAMITAALENIGDLPILKSISPAFAKAFGRNVSKEIAKQGAKSAVWKFLKSGLTAEASETLEEVLQQITQNAAVKTVNENRSLLDGVVETLIQTPVAALPFAGLGGAGSALGMNRTVSTTPAAQAETTTNLPSEPHLTETAITLPSETQLVEGATKEVTAEIKQPAAQEEYSRVVDLPSLETMVNRKFNPEEYKVLRKIGQAPVVKQAINTLTKVPLANDPITRANILKGALSDIAEGLAGLSVRKAYSLADKVTFTPQIDSSLVEQVSEIKDKGYSQALHDIIENKEHYRFSPEARQLEKVVDEIRTISRQVTAMLEREGILPKEGQPAKEGQISRLTGESDFAYLKRLVVKTVSDQAGRTAQQVNDVLANTLPRNKNEGAVEYLTRVSDAIAQGTIEATPALTETMRPVAEMLNVTKIKPSLKQPRKWATVAQGLRNLTEYNPNPVDEAYAMVNLSNKLVVEKRIRDYLVENIEAYTLSELTPGLQEAKERYTALKNAQKAINRALRGEKLPYATVRAIIRASPEIGAQIESAMALPRADVKQLISQFGKELLATLKIDPDALIRQIEQQNGETITLRDVRNALAVLTKEQTKSEKLLEQIYKQAYESRTKEIKEQLQLASKQLAVVREQAKTELGDLVQQNRNAVQAGMGQVIGIPGLSGKYIVTQEIGGKEMLGTDIAKEINKTLGYTRPGEVELAFHRIATVAGALRFFKFGFDVSVSFIQSIGTMGEDVSNLILYPLRLAKSGAEAQRPTASWGKSVVQNVRGFVDLNALNRFYSDPVHLKAAQEYILHGGLLGAPEMVEQQGTITNWLKSHRGGNIPLAVLRNTYGRGASAFSAGLSTAQIYNWEAHRRTAELTGNLYNLAKSTNLINAVFSSRGEGIGATQRNLEGGFLFMAPRMKRAIGATFYHMLTNPGSYTGAMARNAIVGSAVSILGFTTIVMLAMGKRPKLNPLPKDEGGDGADFGGVEIGGHVYGVGGMFNDIRRMTRLLASVTLKPNEYLRFDTTNPLYEETLSYFKANKGIPLSVAYDYLQGRDYYGRETRSETGLPNLNTVKYIGRWGLPSFVEGLVPNKTAAATVLAQFIGLKEHQESMWDMYYRRLGELALSTGRNADDATDRVFLEHTYPELRELRDAAILDSKNRGYSDALDKYFQERAEAKQRRLNLVLNGWDNVKNRRITEGGRYADGVYMREVIQDSGRTLAGEYQNIDLRHQKEREKLARDKKETSRATIAYNKYQEILTDKKYIGNDGQILYNKQDKAIQELKQEYADVWQEVEQREQYQREAYPDILRRYYEDMDRLQVYWNADEEIAKRSPLMKEFVSLYKEYQEKYGKDWAEQLVAAKPALKNSVSIFNKMLDQERIRIRQNDEMIDLALRFWYGYKPLGGR